MFYPLVKPVKLHEDKLGFFQQALKGKLLTRARVQNSSKEIFFLHSLPQYPDTAELTTYATEIVFLHIRTSFSPELQTWFLLS